MGLRVCVCAANGCGTLQPIVRTVLGRDPLQSKAGGAGSSQASEDPCTSLSALDCGCDSPALPVSYNELRPGTVSRIFHFLIEATLGQLVLAASDMKQSQPVNRLGAHLSKTRNTVDNLCYGFPSRVPDLKQMKRGSRAY